MNIKVLGVGCANCKRLHQMVLHVLKQEGMIATVDYITDIVKISEYGLMKTPGLVINNQVVLSGRVPTMDEVKNLLQNHFKG